VSSRRFSTPAIFGAATASKRVAAPKIAGVENLRELTRADALDFFIVCSSLSSCLAPPGQSAYAAANAYLDAFAIRSREEGLNATSISWGPWANGMADRFDAARWKALGLRPLDPSRACRALSAVGGDVPHAIIAGADWTALAAALPAAAPLLSEVIHVRGAAAQGTAVKARERVERAGESARAEIMLSVVCDEVRRVLRIPAAAPLDRDRPLQQLGMDSITALELRNALSSVVGTPLAATTAFDHPTPARLATHLLQDVMKLPTETVAVSDAEASILNELMEAGY